MYRIYKINASDVKCFWADGYIHIYNMEGTRVKKSRLVKL